MAGEAENGVPQWLLRDLAEIRKAVEKQDDRLADHIRMSDERYSALYDRLQQTRDAQGEQRGKLAMLLIIVSAIVSALVALGLNK